MTKFAHLSKKPTKTLAKRKRIFKFKAVDIKVLNVAMSVMVVVMGVGYLVQINGIATKGYQIKELEQQVVALEEQKSDLELETLSLQSMDAVQDKVASLGLVAVGDVEYLNPTPVAVAR